MQSSIFKTDFSVAFCTHPNESHVPKSQFFWTMHLSYSLTPFSKLDTTSTTIIILLKSWSTVIFSSSSSQAQHPIYILLYNIILFRFYHLYIYFIFISMTINKKLIAYLLIPISKLPFNNCSVASYAYFIA